jgi:transcriptional regulator with XRE-family HTH domain
MPSGWDGLKHDGGGMKQHGQPAGNLARQALGQELRAMHQRSGRTLRALERDVSISDSTLSRYFRGRAVPTWQSLEKICAALGEDSAPLRTMWEAAIAERSRADGILDGEPVADGIPDAEPVAGADSGTDDGGGLPEPGRRRRAVSLRRLSAVAGRLGWAAAGLAVGVFIGYLLGDALHPSHAAASSATAGAQPNAGVPAAVTSTLCPWKYVVTDGNPDNLRVFDDPQRDSIVADYAPREVFYAPEPPQIVNGLMRTTDGWVGVGNWVQRYHGSTCRTGGQ